MQKQALLPALIIAAFCSGCVAVRYDLERMADRSRVEIDTEVAAHFARMDELRAMLLELGPLVDPAEADLAAQTAVGLAIELANQYKLTAPPITHNMLVNMGLKPRGLCTHWAEDLLRRLDALELETLDLYWAVAYPSRPWRLEHSGALSTAAGQPFNSGIVLDAWRDSGALFFSPV
ncbi:MAG: hypothetical protein AAF610_05710, partial [Pseudomonadota bacterium]